MKERYRPVHQRFSRVRGGNENVSCFNGTGGDEEGNCPIFA